MMKDTMRQIFVILSILATIVVNGLANALPLNGLNTGQISNRFHVYFVPAAYVFSIWGLIYLGLIIFAVYQALPSQRGNPRLRATGWWVCLSGVANSAWIFLWHYEQFLLTLVAMFVLLISLIIIYLRLGIGRIKVSLIETLAVRLVFSIYLGWITVATVANVTSVLDFIKWDRFGISPEIWMWIILAVVLIIAILMNFTRRDIAYALVILWALAGITVRNAAIPAVVTPTWIAFGVVLFTLVMALLMRRPARK